MSPDADLIEGMAIQAYTRDCASWPFALPNWESLPLWKKAQWFRVARLEYDQARGIKCG